MTHDATRVRRPSTVARYTKLRVTVTRGKDAGSWVEVAGSPVRVGTASSNDLALSDDTVSRHHCEIELLSGALRVRDMGSTNGVAVGGVRLFDGVVAENARLMLGDTELTVTPLAETIDREQASVDRFGDVIGRAVRMRELFADLARIAPLEVTLLIEGETGTGKDLCAESVHAASPRAEGPFVVFDCAAVAPTLVEAELFGHERGAFTGAQNARPGLFEQANGGTIFLDEIGELPKDLQPKLLRALEKRQVRRVGATKTTDVDVRVVAATNRNLRAEVQRGAFREDLYFRLAAAHVLVPPLRDRMDDLPLLVEHFLSRERPPGRVDDVPPHVWDLFRAHRWPGNVRELRNAVQRLAINPDRPIREPVTGDVPAPARSPDEPLLPLQIARREASDAFERAYLKAALAKSGGNVTRAAAMAEVSRQMMQKLMRKHGL
jgi:two-component system, NtrC family, response regulator GlrR